MKRFLALLLSLALLLVSCGEKPADSRPTTGVGIATISAVGDIFPTADMLTDARQANGTYNFTPQFLDVFSALSAADLTIGNLEGTFSGDAYDADDGCYPDELAAVLRSAGFDLLQTANSYSIQGGLSGLQRTIDLLAENGITAVGTYRDAAAQQEQPVVIREINGIRFAFLAFTKGMGGLSLPEDAQGCVNLLYKDYTTDYADIDTDGITAMVAQARAADPDIVIACLHWGSENVSTVSRKQEQIAALLFENGVDVILGSHSHLTGTVEQRTLRLRDGTEKTVVLAYSLGDFCAASRGNCAAAPILNLEFTRNHAAGTTTISNVSFTPVAAVDRGVKERDRYAVLDIDNALRLYESNYYDRVSGDLYDTLKQKRETLLQRLTPELPDAE